jgi:hypothetical protein
MPRRIVAVNSETYVLAADDPPLGGRTWALLHARVVDELTGEPLTSEITLASDMVFASSRVTSDGLVGLVSIPHQVFPSLARQQYTVLLTIRAAGYLPRQMAVAIAHDQRTMGAPAPALHDTVLTLNDTARLRSGEFLLVGPVGPNLDIVRIGRLGPGPQQVTLMEELAHGHVLGEPVVPVIPDDFTPIDLGALAMRREPVVIQGRTVRASGGTTVPLAGATVRVIGIWRTLPPANLSVPAEPPNFVAIQPPLYADRAAVVGHLRRRNLQPVVGDDKFLLDDVLAGATVLRLSNRQNLATGDILAIDADHPDLAEYLAIHTIIGASTVTQPARVACDHPMAYPHRRNTLVQRVTPQALGSQKQLTSAALTGDPCVFLNNLTGFATAREVQLTGGAHPPEYHRVRQFSVHSDSAGYYRLPPLSRVAQLVIRAEHGGPIPVEQEFRPDYALRENRLDFMFQ